MRTRRRQTFLLLSLGVAVWATACGGGPALPPPPPPISVSITPAMASVFLGATQQFTATVLNTPNTAVTWTVNGVSGGDSTLGAISTTGLYTAPQNFPPQGNTVIVQAVSQADRTKFADVPVTFLSDISVTVTPSMASVPRGTTQQFSATVSGSGNPNRAVNWSVNGVRGGSSSVGTVDANGLYSAPVIVPSPPAVTVQAISQADPSKMGGALTAITSDIVVVVSPGTAGIELGAQEQFTATVSGSGHPSGAVTWSVNGVPGGNATAGTIDPTGRYTAPRILPTPASVTITAASMVDPSKTGGAAVALQSNFRVGINGPSSVDTGATALYSATLVAPPGSNPSSEVTWSVFGPGCSGDTCGALATRGIFAVDYTAPLLAPTPDTVTLTATSVADPTKTANFDILIVTNIGVFLSPISTGVALETTQQFTARVGGTTNQNVTWHVNGIVGGDATVGTITQTGLYTAPVNITPTRMVTIGATSEADPTRTGTASVTLFSSIFVQVSPLSETRAVNRRLALSATVINTSNPNVVWLVNAIPNGDPLVGQICLPGSAPCQPPPGPTAAPVEYLAPASVPAAANPVPVQAISQADPFHHSTAVVTIIPQVQVSVSPANSTIPPGGTQQFLSRVVGSSNQGVTWSVSGTSCGGAACGTIGAAGVYTAPAMVPSPASDTVIATSSDDPAQSGSGSIAIGTGPFIRTLRPGAATSGSSPVSFLRVTVQGSDFVSSASGPGSTVLVNNAARGACPTTTECTFDLFSFDFNTPGQMTVQVENPGVAPQTPVRSNQVLFVVVPMETTEDVIPLTASSPDAFNKDIVVVEPSSQGGTGLTLNIDGIGLFTSPTTCNPRGTSIQIARPATGTSAERICVRGDALTFDFTISGPTPNDITLSNPIFNGTLIELTLTLSNTTLPGARTLFVTNSSKDKSAATGAIEVK